MANVPRSIAARFAAIAKEKGYSKETEVLAEQYRKKRETFIAKEVNLGFKEKFGDDDRQLKAWKKLCVTVGFEKAYVNSGKLPDVAACKKLLKGMYVNIVDLVDASRAGKTCTPFKSYKALQEYIEDEEKSYPLGAAKGNPLLRKFLVTLRDRPPTSRFSEKARRRDGRRS